MTLNQFLDVAYALLVDEYKRLGSSLVEALASTREYAAGGHRPVTASGNDDERPALRAVPDLSPEELQNEQALAALEQMMNGVSFG